MSFGDIHKPRGQLRGVNQMTILLHKPYLVNTPEPRTLKKGTFDSNAAINSEGSGDMTSTQNNQI